MFVDIMNIKESEWRQWGKNFGVKGKGHKIHYPYAVVVKKDGITVGKSTC